MFTWIDLCYTAAIATAMRMLESIPIGNTFTRRLERIVFFLRFVDASPATFDMLVHFFLFSIHNFRSLLGIGRQWAVCMCVLGIGAWIG